MAFCPECNIELKGEPDRCYVCGSEVVSDDESGWLLIGIVQSKVFADLARETLESCGIPSVVISKSGFFGNVGLPLNPFYEPKTAAFEVSVPAVHREEAIEVLDATLGEKWQRKEDE